MDNNRCFIITNEEADELWATPIDAVKELAKPSSQR